MCLDNIKIVKNNRRFVYKHFMNESGKLTTPYARMEFKNDTTIWQDASKITEANYKELKNHGNFSSLDHISHVGYDDEHKGLISVYLHKREAINKILCSPSTHEIWEVEIRDKKIKVGTFLGRSKNKCALVKEFRLVEKVPIEKLVMYD